MVTIVVTLTLYFLDGILSNKQTKNKWPWCTSGCIVRLSNLLRFLLTYEQTLRKIFHIEQFYVNIYFYPCIFCIFQHREIFYYEVAYLLKIKTDEFSENVFFIFKWKEFLQWDCLSLLKKLKRVVLTDVAYIYITINFFTISIYFILKIITK